MPATKERVKEKTAARDADRPTAPPPGSLLLKIPEVAYLLGCSCRQARVLVIEGTLKNASFDRTIRVRRGDVLRLIDGKGPMAGGR